MIAGLRNSNRFTTYDTLVRTHAYLESAVHFIYDGGSLLLEIGNIVGWSRHASGERGLVLAELLKL